MSGPRLSLILVVTSILVGGASAPVPAEENKHPRTDCYGDPLPADARVRLGTVRLRHGGLVRSLAFSPDGKTLASGSADGTARLWDRATGKELRRFGGHQSGVNAVAVSPDGKLLATSGGYFFKTGGDHSVRIWDIRSGKLIRVLERTDEKPDLIAGHYLAFSADGKLLAGGSDRTVISWEVHTGKERNRATLRVDETRNGGEIRRVVGTPDGTFLALGKDTKAAIIWDVRTGKRLRQFVGHRKESGSAAIHSLVLSPDGKMLATSGEDRTIRLWDRTTGKQLRELTDNMEKVTSLEISPDGQTLASASWYEPTVRLWDVGSGKLRQKLRQIMGTEAVAFSPDGQTLAASASVGVVDDDDQAIRLWDLSSGRQRPMGGQDGQILSLAFLREEKRIASVGRDGSFRIWDTDSGKELRCTSIGSTRIVRTCLSANGDRLAAQDLEEKKSLCLWDVAAALKRRQLANLPEGIGAFALSPDGRILLASDWGVDAGGHLFLWDLTRDERAKPLVRKMITDEDKNATIDDIVFSADGKWAAVGVYESNVLLVDLAAFKAATPRAKADELARSLFYEHCRSCLALSSGGSTLAMGTWWNSFSFGGQPTREQPALYVRSTADRARERPFGKHKRHESVTAVAFSRDGKTLAAARNDGTILLWDIATAKVRRSLVGHQGPVRQLTFSRDGSLLASGGADTTVLIWDLRRR